MKSLLFSTLTLVCATVFSTNGFAHDNPKSVNETLKERIVQFIDRPDMSNMDGQKYDAEIEFIITRNNRVVVLAVYTNDIYFDEYLKEKLNYRTLNLKGVQKMVPYRLTVNFVQPQS